MNIEMLSASNNKTNNDYSNIKILKIYYAKLIFL